MRIDKYLWAIRVFKTRNLAASEIKSNKVEVNDQVVKPSREVVAGDQISVRKGGIRRSYRILDIPKSRVGAKIVDMYRLETTSAEELEKAKRINESQSYYRQKGIGRPTKKDRRNIEDYILLDFDDDE